MGLGIALSLACMLFFSWRRSFPHPELPVWAEEQAGAEAAASTAAITPFPVEHMAIPCLGCSLGG